MNTNNWKKFIPGCVTGNVLEIYDFIIYGYFSTILSKLFFPLQNEYLSLMATFAVFAGGSIARPFSALIFGTIGDKYGRRVSLIYSIGIMAVSTLLIGMLPIYNKIGILAPALLLLCKICQGLSMSNEEVGAALFLIENAPANRQGFAGSLILGGVYLGLLLGALVAAIIFYLFPANSVQSWAWRLPFILGGIIGIFTLIVRIKQPESLEFVNASKQNALIPNPCAEILKHRKITLLIVVLLFATLGVAVYLLAIFIPNMLTAAFYQQQHWIMLISSFGFAMTFFISLCFGKCADKFGADILLYLGFSGFLILSYPIFYLLTSHSVALILLGHVLFALLLGSIAGSIMPLVVAAFPLNMRFSGSCLGFNLSMSIFGSLAPLTSLYLTKISNSSTAPAFLLMLVAGISLLALISQNKSRRPLYGHQIHCQVRQSSTS